MTQGGVLFELQMPGHLMGGQEFSSLPTPRAQARDVIYNRADYHFNLEEALALLPTPTVNDMGAGKDPQAWDEWAARQTAADGRPAPHGKSLEQEAIRMLPTPTARDHKDFQIEAAKHRPEATDTLNRALAHQFQIKTRSLMGTPTASMSHRSKRGISKAANPREIARMVEKGLPIGEPTHLLFEDGSPSPDLPHNQLFTEPTVSDSIPDSWSG
jgi:hypothetical protein